MFARRNMNVSLNVNHQQHSQQQEDHQLPSRRAIFMTPLAQACGGGIEPQHPLHIKAKCVLIGYTRVFCSDTISDI